MGGCIGPASIMGRAFVVLNFASEKALILQDNQQRRSFRLFSSPRIGTRHSRKPPKPKSSMLDRQSRGDWTLLV